MCPLCGMELGNFAVHYVQVQAVSCFLPLANTAWKVSDLPMSSMVIGWRVSGSDIALIRSYKVVLTHKYKS